MLKVQYILQYVTAVKYVLQYIKAVQYVLHYVLVLARTLSKKYCKLNSTVKIGYHALYGEINANNYIFLI